MIEYDERGEGRQPDFPDAVVLEEQMISGVILKIAAPCNLNCAYCYVYNHEDQSWKSRPKSIPDAVLDSFIRRATSYARRRRSKLSITLHGGEPTLVGPARLDEIARRIREGLGDHLAGLSMQTNGTLIDDEFVEVFERRGINVGVSLDGPADVHDAERVYHNGRGSHADAMRGIEVLQRHGLRPHILSVLNPRLGGAATYRYFREIGVANFDLLLPDVSHDNKQRYYGDLGPTPVADALLEVLEAWLAEDEPEVRLRTLEDLIRGALGARGRTDAFGNPPMSYLIVETDGSIEALDALRVCGEGIAKTGLNVQTDELDDLYLKGSPEVRAIFAGVPLCQQCRACPESATCAGGYLPHRYSKERGFDNPSVWCQDILKVLQHIRTEVLGREPAMGVGVESGAGGGDVYAE